MTNYQELLSNLIIKHHINSQTICTNFYPSRLKPNINQSGLLKCLACIPQSSAKLLYNMLVEIENQVQLTFCYRKPSFSYRFYKKLISYVINFNLRGKRTAGGLLHELGHMFQAYCVQLQNDSQFAEYFGELSRVCLTEFDKNKIYIRDYLDKELDKYMLANYGSDYAEVKKHYHVINEYLKCKDKSIYNNNYSQEYINKVGMPYYGQVGIIIQKLNLVRKFYFLKNQYLKNFYADYSTLGDICGAYMPVKDIVALPTHSKKYYQQSHNITGELFANLFESQLLGISANLEHTQKLLPKTCEYFNKIYNLFVNKYISQ